MQPKISDEKQLILMGMSFYGDPFDSHTGWDEENQIGRLWKRFMAYLSRHPEIVPRSACYEVHISNEETHEKGFFEIFVGVEIEPEHLADVPIELALKVLPPTPYAVFTFSGEEIVSDWEMVLDNWLRTSGYEHSHPYNFQYYDERFKGLANLAASTLDVYLPIKKTI